MRELNWAATPLGAPDDWPQPLKTLVEVMLAANQPMFIAWGPERTLLYNDPYSEILAAKHPAAIGRDFLEVWHEIRDDLTTIVAEAYAGRPVHMDDIALVMERKGYPEETHFAFSYTPVRDEAGAIGGFFCPCVETTEQVIAQREREAALAALSASESNYRYAVDLSPQTVWTAGPDGLLDHVGTRWMEWTGSSGLGTTWGDVLHPDDLQPSIDAWTRSITTGVPYDIEHRARMRDGSYRWMHSRAYPRRDEGGAIVRWYGTTEDIDDSKRAEVARRESEERLRLVADNATDYAIFTLDPQRRVTSWSAGAAAVFGWSAEEMVGESGDLIFTPEDKAIGQPEREMEQALETGCANDERWHVRKDGTRVFMNGSVRPLPPGPDGAPAGAIKIARDETEARRAVDALAESESRFRNMADGAPVMMWVTDETGRCTYLNQRWYEFTGQSRDEAESLGRLGAAHPDDRGAAEAEFLSANAERRPYRAEYRLRRADGVYRWAIDAASPRLDPDGALLGYVGSIIDIDDRREVELALAGSERRLRAALDIAALGLWSWDVGLGRVQFDARARAMFGFSPDEPLQADQVFGRIHEEDRARVIAESQGAVKNAERLDTEYDVLLPDGVRRSIASIGEATTTSGGRAAQMSGTFFDITDQRAARRALERMNAMLEERVAERTEERDRLWTLSQDMLARADYGGGMSAVNPAWTRILGWSEDKLLTDPYAEIIHPDDVDTVVAALNEMGRTGQPTRFENRILTADGDWKPIGWTVAPEPTGTNFIAVGRDLTEDKARQVALEIAQDALRQAQKMEAVGQLTGGIAHDFNNLLTGIVGSLELLQRRVAEGRYEALERYAGVAMTSAQRAAALTQRLLAFSRRQPLDPKAVDANVLVASMEDLLRRTLGPQIDLELALADGLWPTLCDPNQLESAILNLAINARDAMPDGGRLTVETANAHLDKAYARTQADEVEPGHYVAISVTDTGTGIAPDVARRIFEPFFTTKPIGQGTGLGLSQLYGFVKQSGGHVSLYSEVGQGTTFKLYLPRHLGSPAGEKEANAAEPAPAVGDGECVLVVEDEAAVRMLITETLGQLGYHAIEAVDGPSGLKELQSSRRIDLLVTDVGLPGLNGRQLADAARAIRPGLKVLFITGFAGNAAVGNGLLDPGMMMMTKPFAMDQLAARIRAMIEG